MAGYWEGRKDLNYYQVVRRILERLGTRESILDIGPMDTPVASWGQFERRHTIGPDAREPIEGVTAIRGSWPNVPSYPYLPVSVVTCLQVVEHLSETLEFSSALFSAATDLAIVSVPYMWPKGACKYHIHDPIDEAKLVLLVGKEPDRIQIVSDGDLKRLIAEYDAPKGSNTLSNSRSQS